jgi:hypothetical protein
MGVPALREATWKLDAAGQGQGVPSTYYTYATFTAVAASDICTMTGHGFQTGDGPVQLSTDGTLPLGLATSTDYWIERIDADTFYLHATRKGNFATATRVNITGNTTDTDTLNVSSFFIDNPMVGNGRRFYVKNIAIIGDGTNDGTVEVLEGTSTANTLARGEIFSAATGVEANLVFPIYRYVRGVYLGTLDAANAIVLVYTGRN